MHFSLSAAVFLAGVSYASAQTVHSVTVGDGGALAFNPPNITAAIGDKVAFEFRAKNHTVTQSTFAQPCVPGSFKGAAGADSGFAAIPANNTLQPGQFPIWTITVNTTDALWFHCAQATPKDHCQAGMVFSINETPEKSFAAYLANAKAFDPAAAPPAASGAAPATGNESSTADASSTSSGADSSTVASAGSSGVSVEAPSSTLAPGAAAPNAGALGGTGSTAESSNANAPPTTNGAQAVVVSRGAAGLLAALMIGALL